MHKNNILPEIVIGLCLSPPFLAASPASSKPAIDLAQVSVSLAEIFFEFSIIDFTLRKDWASPSKIKILTKNSVILSADPAVC